MNGSSDARLDGSLNISFNGVEGESLLMSLSPYASLSSGSACTSASLEPSYVLRALGVSEELAHTSLRFGIGRFTTDEDVDNIVEHVIHNVERLRDMSPLWELELEGEDFSKGNVKWS
jgi:cysteine desulfurase